jgi:hypothetical protein
MKLTWILCNESIAEDVREILEKTPICGFTVWRDVLGTSAGGEAHWGDAVWPGKNWAFMAVEEDEPSARLLVLLEELKRQDHVRKAGLKAFVQEVRVAL